jgi:hypothetical protein
MPREFSESSEISFDAPFGIDRLEIGIRDPWQDRPAIRFANILTVVNGWTILSKIKLSE